MKAPPCILVCVFVFVLFCFVLFCFVLSWFLFLCFVLIFIVVFVLVVVFVVVFIIIEHHVGQMLSESERKGSQSTQFRCYCPSCEALIAL